MPAGTSGLVAGTMDLPGATGRLAALRRAVLGRAVVALSGVTGEGVADLVAALLPLLRPRAESDPWQGRPVPEPPHAARRDCVPHDALAPGMARRGD